MPQVDIVILGAGTAGMPCAIEAAATGARVLVVEQTARAGGTLHVSLGQMSGSGSKLQAARGIADDPQAHLDDIVRINRGTGRGDLLRRTVTRQGATIDWLMEHGFRMHPSCPAILHLHEAYRTARTYWGVEGGLSVLEAVQPLFEAAMARPNAEIRYETEAEGLLTDASGAVSGVRLAGGETIRAGALVLATGGYGGNPQMFARLTGGRPLISAALPTTTGAGIAMAEGVGAALTGQDKFLPTCAGIPHAPGSHQVIWRQMPSLTPQVRTPWELHLDPEGARFVREDDESVDARENALDSLPGLAFWCVFDAGILAAAPPLLPGWTEGELHDAWATRPDFVRATGLPALAEATGMQPDTLERSLRDYNAACAGAPDPMGRAHCPQPIAGPDYCAIRMHGMVLKTAAGLDVSEDLEVRRADGSAIPGLYAVGEAIGGATLSGRGFVSGMSVTPALTLGRWLGARLGEAALRKETA